MLRAWFKRIYVHCEAPLPTDGPIIFASTHPNSAVDYLFAPLVHGQPTYVLVRGDVFEKKLLNFFFRAIYMLPVYRIRDGYSSLNKNEQSFKDCYHQFDVNGKVLIFSEGICVQEKTLQPVRKGTARLALDYLYKHGGKKIYLVPLATNYSRYRQFRGTAMVNFGAPIEVSRYGDQYAVNANQAYEALTAELERGMSKAFIQARDYHDDSLTERALMALRLGRLETRKAWMIQDHTPYLQERQLVEVLNEKGGNILGEDFAQRADEIQLNPHNEGLLAQRYGRGVYLAQWIILAPYIALAGLTVALPYGLSRLIIRRKIKDVIFDNTVTLFGTLVFYLIQLAAVIAIAWSFMGWTALMVGLVFVLITMLGAEVVDEFLFARHNWNWMHRKASFKELYDRVENLLR
jgi:1-acyl-sn-glycerol-3-phosphate acyltransferase